MAINFHRMTIAVTKDLKRQMDQAVGVNWSAVARQAFTKKIAELKHDSTMRVVHRLGCGLAETRKGELMDAT